jgi:hypothetical protein
MHTLLTLVALTSSFLSGTKPNDRSALAGVAQDDKGKPLAGATVFISTAGPRHGVGVL